MKPIATTELSESIYGPSELSTKDEKNAISIWKEPNMI